MPTAIGSRDQIRGILLLRTVVAMLGERILPPWWRTQFLTDFGLRALTRVFPIVVIEAHSLCAPLYLPSPEMGGVNGRRIKMGRST